MSNLETINLQGQTIIDGKTINNILIYGDGEVLFDFKRAEINEYPSRFSWEKLSTITIEEVKLAKKLNLSRKDNFIIINKEHNYFNESRYDLYIHTKDIATPDEVMCEFFEFLANLAITLVADMGEVNKERYQKVKKIMFIRENNNFIH